MTLNIYKNALEIKQMQKLISKLAECVPMLTRILILKGLLEKIVTTMGLDGCNEERQAGNLE